MLKIKPIYSLLAIAAVIISIAASSALQVLTGNGERLLWFALGAGVGMGWACYVGMSNYVWFSRYLDEIMSHHQDQIESLGEIAIALKSPHLFLQTIARSSSKFDFGRSVIPDVIPPDRPSAELVREIEVRELLDSVYRLSGYVLTDGICRCCGVNTKLPGREGEHSPECDYAIAMSIYDKGRSRRGSWSEFVAANQL